jgi:ATP-dependent Zn protease
MDEMSGLMPLNLRDSAITMPIDLTAGQAARAEALDADDQLAALHEAGHAVMATVAATPSFPVSSIDIKSRMPRTELAEGDDNMPRWHRAARFRALIVVSLGGWAAEKVLLGEPTTGGDDDLTKATRQAVEMIGHGLDPDAPFISHEAFGGYGQLPVPAWLSDAIAQAAVNTLAEARDRALALAEEHKDAIRSLAAIVYRERRLTDHAVTAALRAVGLSPSDIRP